MKRQLVVRFLALELGPMVGAIAICSALGRVSSVVLAVVAFAVFTNVALSIRSGAVLKGWGCICEKTNGKGWSWSWIGVHALFGVFYGTGALLVFLRP